jgi:hypothetical protein
MAAGPEDKDNLNEPSTMQSVSGHNQSKMKPIPPQPSKPFDSTSPRFNYRKTEEKSFMAPGPG